MRKTSLNTTHPETPTQSDLGVYGYLYNARERDKHGSRLAGSSVLDLLAEPTGRMRPTAAAHTEISIFPIAVTDFAREFLQSLAQTVGSDLTAASLQEVPLSEQG
jgi:hypothetical protein